MKKALIALSLFASLFSHSDVGMAKANPNAKSNVVYYIPHQDDEALTFGVSIMAHLKGGHNVHVVLLTDGAASAVRKKLNMTEKEFTAARNREFALSLKNMGVKKANIHYMNYKDSQLTVSNVDKVVRSFEKKYPKAKHKTFSWTDSGNHDHSNAGKALVSLQKKKVVSDARYYVRRGDNPKGLRLTTDRYQSVHAPIYKKVSKAYSTYNPKTGFYAVGRTSVKKSFIEFDKKPLSRYHK